MMDDDEMVAEQALPIAPDWPAHALLAMTETLDQAATLARDSMMLAETAQGDANALHAAVLDCLDTFEEAEAGAQGRTQLAANTVYARAAKEMALRLRQLAGPNVSRETSADDDTVASAEHLLTVVGCSGSGAELVNPLARTGWCPACGVEVAADTRPSDGKRVILWHTPGEG